MDLDSAVLAHSRWKDKIKESIRTGAKLDADLIARDDQCDLGKWLRAASPADGVLPEFQAVMEKHTHFHKVAAETARQVARLPKEEAEKLLVGATKYGLASAGCIGAIVALRNALQKQVK